MARARVHPPEWYRPGLNDSELMDETESLLRAVVEDLGLDLGWGSQPFGRMRYHQCFEEMLGHDLRNDPHRRLGLYGPLGRSHLGVPVLKTLRTWPCRC